MVVPGIGRTQRALHEDVSAVAVLSMHTSPLAQPGTGDGGGMNVYVRELALSMSHLGSRCDIYVRRSHAGEPDEVEIEAGVVVRFIEAGPHDLPKEQLPSIVDEFTEKVAVHLDRHPVDALHAHYWLSGVAGHELKHRLDLPLAVTFHTLGRVKSLTGDVEPADRIAAEHDVVGCADVVFASGRVEAEQLVGLYGVDPARIETLTPGVDLAFFSPGQRWAARQAVGLGSQPIVLFVGRIQPLKGLDVAVETLSHLASARAKLVVVGGPSGVDGERTLREVRAQIDSVGLTSRVEFVPPQPHHLLSTYYRAADVCIVPSRSESFGLVALEASACGTPVVASDVGGLRDNVVDGMTGFLVTGRDPGDFAKRIDQVLDDPLLALRMGEAGAVRASEHGWDASAAAAVGVFDRLQARELVSCA